MSHSKKCSNTVHMYMYMKGILLHPVFFATFVLVVFTQQMLVNICNIAIAIHLQMSQLMRSWLSSSSVNSFFKQACAAIQWD